MDKLMGRFNLPINLVYPSLKASNYFLKVKFFLEIMGNVDSGISNITDDIVQDDLSQAISNLSRTTNKTVLHHSQEDFGFDLDHDEYDISKNPNYGFLPLPAIHRILIYLPPTDINSAVRSSMLINIIANTSFFWSQYYSNYYETIIPKDVSKRNWKREFFNRYFSSESGARKRYVQTHSSPSNLHDQIFTISIPEIKGDDTDPSKQFITSLLSEMNAGIESLPVSLTYRDLYEKNKFPEKTQSYRFLLSNRITGNERGVIFCFSMECEESFEKMKKDYENFNTEEDARQKRKLWDYKGDEGPPPEKPLTFLIGMKTVRTKKGNKKRSGFVSREEGMEFAINQKNGDEFIGFFECFVAASKERLDNDDLCYMDCHFAFISLVGKIFEREREIHEQQDTPFDLQKRLFEIDEGII